MAQSLPWGPQRGSVRPFGDRRRSGVTPLHWAALNGHSELVKVLLAAGPGGPRPLPPPAPIVSPQPRLQTFAEGSSHSFHFSTASTMHGLGFNA